MSPQRPDDPYAVTSLERLLEVYPLSPAPNALAKESATILPTHARVIAASPFCVISTVGDGGLDQSPRGDTPGFVRVRDERTLVVPDRRGNNRLDTLRNIVEGGAVAVLLFVPGVDETMRVNGTASVSVDADVLARCPIGELRANVAVVVEVRNAFIHCAKALRRSGLWHPDEWPDSGDMATPACMLRDHIGMEGTVEDSQRALDESYATSTWKMAGER